MVTAYAVHIVWFSFSTRCKIIALSASLSSPYPSAVAAPSYDMTTTNVPVIRAQLSRGADAKGDFPPYARDVGIVNSFFRGGGSSFLRRTLNHGGGAMRCRNVGPFRMSRNADQIAPSIARQDSRCEHVVGCDWLSAGSDHRALRRAMQAASAQKENRQVSDSYRPSRSDMYHGQ